MFALTTLVLLAAAVAVFRLLLTRRSLLVRAVAGLSALPLLLVLATGTWACGRQTFGAGGDLDSCAPVVAFGVMPSLLLERLTRSR